MIERDCFLDKAMYSHFNVNMKQAWVRGQMEHQLGRDGTSEGHSGGLG
jgi:hypothetical protein